MCAAVLRGCTRLVPGFDTRDSLALAGLLNQRHPCWSSLSRPLRLSPPRRWLSSSTELARPRVSKPLQRPSTRAEVSAAGRACRDPSGSHPCRRLPRKAASTEVVRAWVSGGCTRLVPGFDTRDSLALPVLLNQRRPRWSSLSRPLRWLSSLTELARPRVSKPLQHPARSCRDRPAGVVFSYPGK